MAKDAATKPRAGAVLHHLLEALFVTAVLLRPFLPATSEKLLALLAMPAHATLAAPWQWGATFAPGHVTGAPEILFPRIETERA